MLLTPQQQTQKRVEHTQEADQTKKKRRWPRLTIISFWVGLLILVNIAIAAWINTDSQFAVEEQNTTLSQKITQSLQEGKERAFRLLRGERRTFRSKRTTQGALPEITQQGMPGKQMHSAAPKQDDTQEQFSIRAFWKFAKNVRIPDIGSPLPDSPDAIAGPQRGGALQNLEGFARGIDAAGKMIGVPQRLNVIGLQDRIIDVVSAQVKGASVMSVGRQTPNGYREFVVVGEEVGKFYDQVSTPVVSPDGGSVAYFALEGEIMKVVLDGREIAFYKDFGPTVYQNGIPLEGTRSLDARIPPNYLRSFAEQVLQFKPNGELVYTAWKSKKPLVVVGGSEGEQFDVVHNPVISPDGSRIAYVVAQAMNIGAEVTTPGGCNSPECIHIFSNMANRAFAKRAYTYFVIADGLMSFPYDEILDLTFSENGQSFGFLGKRDNKWYAIINNDESHSYDEIRGLQFSADGKQYAFAARIGDTWNSIANGIAIAQLANAVGNDFLYNFGNGSFAYSDVKGRFFARGAGGEEKNIPGFLLNVAPGEKQVALLRQVGTETQVVLYDLATGMEVAHDPAATAVQSLISGAGKTNLVFSADGKHVAYPLSVTSDGQTLEQMVVDGVRHLPYRHVTKPVFSPDGLLVAYAATALDPLTGIERALAVIGGRESEFYDRMFGQPHFSPDGSSVQYLVEKDGSLEWITHSLADVLSQGTISLRQVSASSPFPGLFCPPEAVYKDMEIALQEPNRVCGLSLPDGNRTVLPENIGTMLYLKHLNLSFNRIETIPPSIGNLSDLRWLSLVGNSIAELPKTLGNLSRLEYLDVSSNALRRLPDTIGNLQNLRILNVSGNDLRGLPESLKNLTNLERLYLNGNSIPKKQMRTLQEQLPATRVYGLET